MRTFRKVFLYLALGLTLVCLVGLGILAIANRNLPNQSQTVERLSADQKALLAETTHLRMMLGGEVWPGWDRITIPYIVYNEDYAFLVGYPDPPAGWVKVPQNERRGGEWEAVPNDTYQGQAYYRQPLPDPEVTPENFTVLVGDRWVATLFTREAAAVSFYTGFREELPAFVRPVFPYRLAWRYLGGESTAYISALAHESFHVYQGLAAPGRLEAAEQSMSLEAEYPWDDPELEAAWGTELDLLADAAQAESDEEAAELARQFLAQREQRRGMAGYTADWADFERQREWLEGLAKYAELVLGTTAADSADYAPLPEIFAETDFKSYDFRRRFYAQQLDEVRRMTGHEGETRFYYTGFAQGVLLDRLDPDWKSQAFQPGVWLEDLLRQAVQ